MQYKALISFSGLISMSMGEVREIADQKIVNDLLKAGYIQPNVGSEPRPSAVIDKSKIVDNEPPSKANKEVHDNHREAGQSRQCLDGAKRSKKEEVKKTRKGGKKKSEN